MNADAQEVTVIRQELISSGPLPPPEILARYDAIKPGFAQEIMDMAKRQMAHRQELESVVIRADVERSGRGQWFGLLIGIAGIVGSVWCACVGQPIPASVIGGTTLVGLVGAFLFGSKQRQDEREKKRKRALNPEVMERPPNPTAP